MLTMDMLVWTVLALGPAQAPAPTIRVLIGPVEAKGGLPQDQADLLAFALSRQVAQRPGLTAVLLKEVEGTLQYQNLKQVVGCESASCAAEIAGSLDADEIIFGTLNRVGDEVYVALSRVAAGSATVQGRALVRVELARLGSVIQDPAGLVAQLYGALEAAAAPAPAAGASPSSPEEEQGGQTAVPDGTQKGGGMGTWLARAVGGVMVALGGAALLWAGALVAANLGILGWDVSLGGSFGARRIPLLAGLLANGALLGAGALALVTAGLLIGGAVVLGASLVVP